MLWGAALPGHCPDRLEQRRPALREKRSQSLLVATAPSPRGPLRSHPGADGYPQAKVKEGRGQELCPK